MREAHSGDVNCVAFAPRRDAEQGEVAFNHVLVTGSADSTVKLWDARKLGKRPAHSKGSD